MIDMKYQVLFSLKNTNRMSSATFLLSTLRINFLGLSLELFFGLFWTCSWTVVGIVSGLSLE